MTDVESARLAAERFIDYQARSSAEVRRRLTTGGYTPEVVDQVVEDLESAGLLDDSRFGADWVESRNRSKGLGRVRLRSELRRKGLTSEEAESAVNRLDPATELEAAFALASKRAAAYDMGDAASRRKLASYLQRRGYTWGIIEQVFTKLVANSD